MRTRDTFDVMCSSGAIIADALAIFGGILLAAWIRFDTNWIPMFHDAFPPRSLYIYGAGVATLLFLFLFQSLDLYVRPQTGLFGDIIPRLVRATSWSILLATALAFVIRTDPPFSRIVAGISFFSVMGLIILERCILFHLELHFAKHREIVNRVIVLGTDSVALRIKLALKQEPRLRSRVIAFLRTNDSAPDSAIPAELIKGRLDELEHYVFSGGVDQVVLADTSLPHERVAEIILNCERGLVSFLLVPDLYSVLTTKVHVENVGDIPLIGFSKWPLDYFWNRFAKRAEDIAGSLIGLIASAPALVIAAALIKGTSRGPIFYRQERCGEGGERFFIYKLRTMKEAAESETGPVWATESDPRRTKIGAFLRRHNLDELPQFWNVLTGDMSLVGPRPERLHFVEQFKEDISRYMRRHVSKPGMTGWAQVNGLRGNTDIRERIKYDLYYLENWSLAFDFKILMKTFFARKNAY
jgi:exopolysaccharide biosynthesis polyprenyl glycosylphosphotransferase